MPASTLQINLDKTYNIVLFKGLSNGEYINNMKGLGGPVILYRLIKSEILVHVSVYSPAKNSQTHQKFLYIALGQHTLLVQKTQSG